MVVVVVVEVVAVLEVPVVDVVVVLVVVVPIRCPRQCSSQNIETDSFQWGMWPEMLTDRSFGIGNAFMINALKSLFAWKIQRIVTFYWKENNNYQLYLPWDLEDQKTLEKLCSLFVRGKGLHRKLRNLWNVLELNYWRLQFCMRKVPKKQLKKAPINRIFVVGKWYAES